MLCEVMIQMRKPVGTGGCTSSMPATAKGWSKRNRSALIVTVQDLRLYPQTVAKFNMKYRSVD